MKQITIISGKGGTGKTTIAAAFSHLASGNAVFADCDVDAPDLHLILKPKILETRDFFGSNVAVINPEKCVKCGICREKCRFGAIDEGIQIHEESCEGCGVCALVCPQKCIEMKQRKGGSIYVSETRFGPMVHANLEAGGESSGKLVSMVRDTARKTAKSQNKEIIIIDGSPGIGCPVIASITGTDLALIVTEPTVSGIHDMRRVIEVAKHFKVPAAVCINKADINKAAAEEINKFCAKNEIPVVGMLPYDTASVGAMITEKAVTEFGDSALALGIRKMWEKIK